MSSAGTTYASLRARRERGAERALGPARMPGDAGAARTGRPAGAGLLRAASGGQAAWGLAARAVEERGPLARRAAFAAARALAGALLAAGALAGLAQIVGLAVPAAALFGLCLAGAVLASAAALDGRAALALPVVALAAAVAAALAAPQTFVEGARALWNCLASTLADASSLRLPELALADAAARDGCASAFVLAASPWAGALAAGLAGARRPGWLLLMLAFPLFMLASCGTSMPLWPTAAVGAGAAAALGLAAARGSGAPSRQAGGPMRAACALLAAALALAGAGAGALALSPASWHQPPALENLASAVGTAVHDARYGTQPNGLRGGDFARLGAWEAADGVQALSIETDDPQPMYLRGFVGARYDSTGWHEQEEADYHASDALFWWLHEDGFFAQSQLAGALGASLQDADAARQLKSAKKELSADAARVSVSNLAASSEWLYAPYGLVSLDGDVACKDRADEGFAPRGLLGKRSYALNAVMGLETAYPDIAALSWIARDDEAAYWKDESNYNAFVYERYAKNSDVDEAAVTEVLGDAGLAEGEHVDYAAAAQTVTSWLAANVVYDESYGRAEGGADVLTDVLSGAKRGWSAHFATAAVAMLRHYGIPARYVEGYLVTPEAIAGAGGGAVAVGAADGHAWAEMYVDGTGWVPLETVPAVRAKMPQPDWASGIRADGVPRETTPPEQQHVQEPDLAQQVVELLQATLAGLGRAILVVLALFDLFALVFFLVTVVRRHMARRRRRIAFSQEDDTLATRSMAAWMAELARFRFPQLPAGDAAALGAAVEQAYGADVAADWAAAQAVGRKAAFSVQGVGKEERAAVAEASERFAGAVSRTEGLHARWMMKYIERLL